jgi:hypothetical protein
MKTYYLPITLAFCGLLSTHSLAQTTNEANAGAAALGSGQFQNETHNTSEVGGTLNNTQINQGYFAEPSQYRIREAVCSQPSFSFGSYYNERIGPTIVGGLYIPIGGQACHDIANEYLEQAQLDTTINVIQFCLSLKEQGQTLSNPLENPEIQSIVDICQTVNL